MSETSTLIGYQGRTIPREALEKLNREANEASRSSVTERPN